MRQRLLTWLCHVTKANVATRNNPKLGVGLGRRQGEIATLEFFRYHGTISNGLVEFYTIHGIPKEFYHD
jgi:hypothetical protein